MYLSCSDPNVDFVYEHILEYVLLYMTIPTVNKFVKYQAHMLKAAEQNISEFIQKTN